MKLNKVYTFTIKPTTPFLFDATFHKPDHFPSNDGDWEKGTKWQTWLWQNKTLGLKFISRGTVKKPQIDAEIYYTENLKKDIINDLKKEIIYKFNLDADFSDFYRKFKNDKVLGDIIKKWKGLRPGHQGSLYEYTIIGIMLQNAHVKRSVNMLQSLFENYGTLLEYDNKKLWCFWKPGKFSNITEEKLKTLKVGYRAKSIIKVDKYFSKGQIDELKLRKEDEETQKKELLKVYGVGPATVWYLLFDIFHHWDSFSHISPWEQKIYSKVFFNKDPEEPVPVEKIMKYFEKYSPYKRLAVHYIWENLWWKRKNEPIPWLENLIKL